MDRHTTVVHTPDQRRTMGTRAPIDFDCTLE